MHTFSQDHLPRIGHLCGIQSEIRDRQQDHARLGLAPRLLAALRADTVHRVIGTIIDAGYRAKLHATARTRCAIGLRRLANIRHGRKRVDRATLECGPISRQQVPMPLHIGRKTAELP